MRRALGIAALGVECLVLLLVLHDPVAAAQLTLTWVDAVGATQYLVERENISLGLFAEIARVGADATSYVDTAVLPGITYCYRLRAASAAGYSDYSNVACGAAAAGVGSFFDDFSRPDAGALGNGWTTVAGTLQGYGAVERRPLLPRWLRLRRTRRAPAIPFGGGPDHVTGNLLLPAMSAVGSGLTGGSFQPIVLRIERGDRARTTMRTPGPTSFQASERQLRLSLTRRPQSWASLAKCRW